MSDDDNEPPAKSLFSKRAKFTPNKSAEELQAAAAILSKVEGERSVPKIDDAEADDLLPPVVKKGGKKKGARQSADDQKDVMPDLSNTRLSPAARKRLKKLKEDRELERAEVEAKNAKVFEAKMEEVPTDSEEPEVPEKKIFALTVTCVSKVARFKCNENENFKEIFEKVGHVFHLKPSEFILCLKDINISITDTPKNLCISELDILECIPYKIDDNADSFPEDDNRLKITFQSNDMKSKIDMIVNKLENMQSVMERYSRKRGVPLNELTFEFDGYKLIGTETPLELDMESGNCIDVRVFAPIAGSSSRRDDIAVAHCSSASDDTAVAHCSSATDDTAVAHCSSASGDTAVAHHSSASGDTAVAHCSSASDDTAVAQCSPASDNTAVAHCSYTSNDPPFELYNFSSDYLPDDIIQNLFADSNDSDIIILD